MEAATAGLRAREPDEELDAAVRDAVEQIGEQARVSSPMRSANAEGTRSIEFLVGGTPPASGSAPSSSPSRSRRGSRPSGSGSSRAASRPVPTRRVTETVVPLSSVAEPQQPVLDEAYRLVSTEHRVRRGRLRRALRPARPRPNRATGWSAMRSCRAARASRSHSAGRAARMPRPPPSPPSSDTLRPRSRAATCRARRPPSRTSRPDSAATLAVSRAHQPVARGAGRPSTAVTSSPATPRRGPADDRLARPVERGLAQPGSTSSTPSSGWSSPGFAVFLWYRLVKDAVGARGGTDAAPNVDWSHAPRTPRPPTFPDPPARSDVYKVSSIITGIVPAAARAS